jgi:hypothetical protein
VNGAFAQVEFCGKLGDAFARSGSLSQNFPVSKHPG